MEKKNLITLVVVAVLALIVGGVLGMSMQAQKDAPQIQKAEKFESTIKSLSSKIVPSIMAYGQVSNINGRDLTIVYGTESLTINIKDDATIQSFVPPSNGSAPIQQKVEINALKNGDSVNIGLELVDGKLIGKSVVILVKK